MLCIYTGLVVVGAVKFDKLYSNRFFYQFLQQGCILYITVPNLCKSDGN